MLGSIDRRTILSFPACGRSSGHFQLDGGAGNRPSSRFDYVLDLSSLERWWSSSSFVPLWTTSSQVTSLKRVGGWLHIWSNYNPFEELQAIADGLESAEAIYICTRGGNGCGQDRPGNPPYPWSPEGW